MTSGVRGATRRRLVVLLVVAALVAAVALASSLVAGRSSSPPRSEPSAPHGPRPTSFGASFQVMRGESYRDALTRTERTLGGLDVVRVYYPGAPEPWPGKAPGRSVVVSFKLPPRDVLRGIHDEAMRRWFAEAPTDVTVWWSYWHEPEDDIEDGAFTARQYRRAFTRLARLADRAGPPSLQATLILMSYTLDPVSGRRWRAYYPGDEAVDVFAWDVYNRVASPECTYCPPEALLEEPIAVARSVGKPFGVAELGSARAADDLEGTGRARWIAETGEYLVQQGAVFVTWFDFLWNDGRDDYRLLDLPSVESWRSLSG